jgi:hypothetical protein
MKSKKHSKKHSIKRKTRRQYKIWNMKGCSGKKSLGVCKYCGKKHFFSKCKKGGNASSDFNLGYTGKPMTNLAPNPHLAFTGNQTVGNVQHSSMNLFPNPLSGGACGSCGLQQGGGCGCGQPLQGGGGKYPNGLVGSAWTPKISGWPGVDGISGNRNYLQHNNYNVDPQTQNIIQERNTPVSLKGGRKYRRGTRKYRNGGGLIPQDLVNVGRELTYGLGSAYNTLAGYNRPVNPLPFKDQMNNKYQTN